MVCQQGTASPSETRRGRNEGISESNYLWNIPEMMVEFDVLSGSIVIY